MTSSARSYLNDLDADGVLIGDIEMAAPAITLTRLLITISTFARSRRP
jgi:hypothetical protein